MSSACYVYEVTRGLRKPIWVIIKDGVPYIATEAFQKGILTMTPNVEFRGSYTPAIFFEVAKTDEHLKKIKSWEPIEEMTR